MIASYSYHDTQIRVSLRSYRFIFASYTHKILNSDNKKYCQILHIKVQILLLCLISIATVANIKWNG